jgi:hypothetical protein
MWMAAANNCEGGVNLVDGHQEFRPSRWCWMASA